MSIREIKENLGSEKQQEIIDEYIKNNLTIRQIAKKYNLRRKYIGKVLRFNDVYVEGSFITKKNKEIFESEIGQKIIQEYPLQGNNVRSLSRKYNLKRSTIDVILKHANIILKSNKDTKKEYKDLGLCIGKNHPRYGKQSPKGSGRCQWYYYNGKTYQGTWEFKVGLWFEQQNKKFYCHDNVKQFKYELNNTDKTYCPDFYLPDENVFIEVKGYFTKEDKQKIETIKKLYPNEKIEIFDKTKLKKLSILDIDKQLNIMIDEYEICYKNNDSLNSFIEKCKTKKIEIIKDFLFTKLNLTELAKKYETTYRVINQIYHLWIEDYFKNKNLREEFFEKYCKEELNSEYSQNHDLNSLIKRCRISREVFNKIITDDARQKRIDKQKDKYNENYGKHLLKFNLPEITQELKDKILFEYQNNQKSIREICKMFNLYKRKVKKILENKNLGDALAN